VLAIIALVLGVAAFAAMLAVMTTVDILIDRRHRRQRQ
jgi:hypothetical protein